MRSAHEYQVQDIFYPFLAQISKNRAASEDMRDSVRENSDMFPGYSLNHQKLIGQVFSMQIKLYQNHVLKHNL